MFNHFLYGILVLLARRHFYNRVKERKLVEIKLIKKLLKNKLSPEYLPVLINSPFALELLEPNSNVTVKGVDIRKIKVIRDFVKQLEEKPNKSAKDLKEISRYHNLLKCLEDGVSITFDKIDKMEAE